MDWYFRHALLGCWIGLVISAYAELVWSQEEFTPPTSPRECYNFNLDWKFIRAETPNADVPGFEAPEFDDSRWTKISTPHTFNDVDSFRTIISHSGGDRGAFKGLGFYRKHFKLPQSAAGGKVFLEFEGMRQAGEIFLNGKAVGVSENGVTAYGVDITGDVNFGNKENVLAVRVDNRTTYVERATGTPFQWNVNDFNPDFGGINRRVWLHITGNIYQTLPVYDGLQTTGGYVYPAKISVRDRISDLTVESQVHNASDDRATVTLSVVVVDENNLVRASSSPNPWIWSPARNQRSMQPVL